MGTRQRIGTAPVRALGAVSVLLLVAACGSGRAGPAVEDRPGAAGLDGARDGSQPLPSVADGNLVCFSDLGTAEAPDPRTVDERQRPALPPGFVPVAAVSCSEQPERVPGEGEWSVRVRYTVSGDLTELLAALQVPDEPRGGGCEMWWDSDPAVWLIDAQGRAVRPAWPRDPCSHLQRGPLDALQRLTRVESGRKRVRLVTPEAAIDAGCDAEHKNMVGIEAATAVGRGSFGELQDTGSGRVCRFGPHPAEALAGVFAAGARLDGRRWSDLVRDLAATGPARRCARQSTAFAVIGTPERGTVYLELDGCRRILAGGGLRQAPPTSSPGSRP